MNRAILVVMCDFIVVSMLSMITGLSTLENPYGDDGAVVNSRTANVIIEQLRNERVMLEEIFQQLKEAQEKFGYSQARADALQKLEVQMAKTKMQLELLQTKDISNQAVTERSLHKIEQANLNSRYSQAMQELNNIESKNKLDTFNFGNSGSGNGSSNDNKIAGYTTETESNSQEIRSIKDLLAKREVDLEHTMNELAETEDLIRTLDKDKVKLNEQISEYKNSVDNMTQELSNAEDKLLQTQKQLITTKQQISSKAYEINEHKKQITSMRLVLKRAVTDLSNAKREADIKTKEIENIKEVAIAEQNRLTNEIKIIKEKSISLQKKLAQEAEDARKSLEHMKKSLGSNVLVTYKNTIKNLQIKNSQKRMLNDYKNGGNYYLPVIKLDGKYVVISLFRLLSGNSLNKAEFEDIYELDYQLNNPNESDYQAKPTKLTGPLFVSRKDCRVALLELPDPPKETLQFTNVKELRARGFHDLYLFKSKSYGKNGGTLEGRCSMSMNENDDYLYIRNGDKSSSAQISAELGDLVMSREGSFVGIVVKITKLDNGKEEAKCFVFPEKFELYDSIKLPIKKGINQDFYEEFSKLGNKVFARILQLEDK